MRKKTILYIFLFIILCIFLHSCFFRHEVVFEEGDCAFPCWRGIEMGMTSSEVLEKLKAMPDIVQYSITVRQLEFRIFEKAYYFRFRNAEMDAGSIFFLDDKVALINLSNPSGETKKLDYWVRHLGEPSDLSLYGSGITHYALYNSFYFMDANTCLDGVLYKAEEQFTVSERHKIENIVLFDNNISPELADFSCYSIDRMMHIQEWKGYDTYEVCPTPDSPCWN
ncbi:MAG: hypothetical protein ACOYKC_07225 [Anaerolineaceae bacterium]